MVEQQIEVKQEKARYSPYVTGLIQGILIGMGFIVAIVATAMYFGVVK